jgi:cell division protein FtsN
VAKKPAAKANTSKPLTKKTTTGKVTKKPAPAKKAKAAVNGAAKKVEKAGEKVSDNPYGLRVYAFTEL